MIDRVVTVTGPPGSGKSTAGRLVARRLGLDYRSAGDLFRAEAKRRGLSLEEFSRYAEQHEEVDRALDAEMVGLAKPGRLLDGRISGAMCRRAGVPLVYLVVVARPDVRFARIAGRDGVSSPRARREAEAREASERDRFRRYYGIDLDAESPDQVLDSSDLGPEEVADRIVEFLSSLRSVAPA